MIVGSSCCARAIEAKSMEEMELDEACRVSTSTRDKASAAALDEPLRKRISDVNCAIKSR